MPGDGPIAPACAPGPDAPFPWAGRAPRPWAAPMHPPPKPVDYLYPASIRLVAALGTIRACNKMPAEAWVSPEQVACGEF